MLNDKVISELSIYLYRNISKFTIILNKEKKQTEVNFRNVVISGVFMQYLLKLDCLAVFNLRLEVIDNSFLLIIEHLEE